MKTLFCSLLVALLFPTPLVAKDVEPDRFVAMKRLPAGGVVVVAEGDKEPRSTGSYSVRLYTGENPGYATDDFVSGLVRARDGTIQKLVLTAMDGNKTPELIVIIQSAGSGGNLSADAFSIDQKKLRFLASVEGLAGDADPVAALQSKIKASVPKSP